MAHGGARARAGRKPGQATKINEEARQKAAEGGLMPLDYMLATLRDESLSREDRMDAAKAAANYVHAKLANVDVNAKHEGGITVEIVRFSNGAGKAA